MRILASYAIKGGVGKTATAVNLAWEAWRGGASVLVWDMDPQGAASFYFRVAPEIAGGAKRLVRGDGDVASLIRGSDYDGLDVLPADFSYRHLDLYLDAARRPTRRLVRLLAPLAERYDVAILDCAPGISLVSESVFALAGTLLVPTIPTTLSPPAHAGPTGRACAATTTAGAIVRPFLSLVDRREASTGRWPTRSWRAACGRSVPAHRDPLSRRGRAPASAARGRRVRAARRGRGGLSHLVERGARGDRGALNGAARAQLTSAMAGPLAPRRAVRPGCARRRTSVFTCLVVIGILVGWAAIVLLPPPRTRTLDRPPHRHRRRPDRPT
ncbi:MAG: AAA family ATPase [Anaerolineae bacterium]